MVLSRSAFLGVLALVLVTAEAEFNFPIDKPDSVVESIHPFLPFQEVDESYRLPKDTVPVHYTIHLRTIVHEGDREFEGSVDIHLRVIENTNEIVVHNRGLVVTSAVLYQQNGDDLSEIDRPIGTTDSVLEQLTFQCAVQLTAGEEYILKITYSGELSLTRGFFRKFYRDENNLNRYLASTQFEPTGARMAFPCYDEPSLKAMFTISITHHNSYNAVSNMPVEDVVEVEDDPEFHTTIFERSESPMSTYLVAFVVSDFETRNFGLQLIHARPNAIEETEFALEAGEKILTELSTYMDISYYNYMPKMAQIAIPDWGTGAMENWGLVTYGEPVLLFDPTVNTFRNQKSITTIIAHEYGHQWFGNLVTADWWKYIWLNEGFATLFGYLGAHLAYPDQEYMDLFQLDVVQLALGPDSSEATRPMNWNAATPAEISALFDRVAYEKSGSVLNMFRIVLGEDNWRAGLKSYLLSNALATATAEDLYAALQSAISGQRRIPDSTTVKETMETWTEAAGYPVLNVRRNYQSGEIILSQERFLADKKLPNDHVWYIPYNLADQRDPNFELNHFLWLTSKAAKLVVATDPEHWLIFNRRQFGFYRVNYDTRNWELITNELIRSPNSIHHYNRAQLIDDAFNLARAELLDFSVVLKLLTSLANDQDYLPWAAANNVLNYLYNKFRGTEYHEHFEFFVQSLIENTYASILVDSVDSEETLQQKYLKQLITTWACKIGHSDCLDRTYQAFTTALRDDVKIDPDISSAVYCFGMQRASDSEFVAMYERLLSSNNAAERTLLIDALGCSHSDTQLESLLTTSIGAGVGVEVNYFDSERTRVLQAVYSASRTGVDALIRFLNDWDIADDLIYWLEQPAFNNAILGIAARTNTEQELDLLKQLFETVGTMAPENIVTAALATVQDNFNWHSSLEGLIVTEFLENFAV